MRHIEDQTGNLLETKLEVPLTDRRIVPRRRLTTILDDGVKRCLTLVVAPTGYGKTTLLVEWVLHGTYSDSRIAWVNLDRYSNPPLRFWSYIVYGIKKAIPNLRYDLKDYVKHGYDEQDFIILNPLLNEIANLKEQVILILDDFHTITDQVVIQGLMYLIDHKPGNLHLIISGRRMPGLPLSRLIARRQLLQITQQDLAFTYKEIEFFLNQIMELKLDQGQIARMLENSEGWIAGIQLVGLSNQSWPEPDLIKNQLGNDNRQIYAYLTQEVLNSQDETMREFLLKTSILEELTAPLCDYILERSDSQLWLSKVEEANLFLICMDYPNCGYRYHSLFAETLQKHLAQSCPDLVPELHRRACAWMLENDMPEKAISHALAAGDLEWAANILHRHAIPALKTHDIFNLAKWIGYFTEDLFVKHPQLGIYKAFVNYHLGRIGPARENLRQVKQLLNSPAGKQHKEEERILIQWEHDALEAVLHTTEKDFLEAIESIHTVLEESPSDLDPYFTYFLEYNLALTYEIVGDLSTASRFFFKGYEYAVEQKDVVSQFENLIDVSRLKKMQGDFNASEQTLIHCRQLCHRHGLGAPYVVIVETAIMEKALERCDFEKASVLVKRISDALIDILNSPRLWLSLDWVYSKLVEYFLVVRDRDNLEKNFAQMLKYTPYIRGDFPDMPWNLVDVQVRGWLALETDPNNSQNLSELKAFLSNKRTMRLEEQIAFNRILLAQGHLDKAQAGLEQLVNSLAATQLRDHWLQSLILLSLVYWNKGMENSASQAFHSALEYGQSAGYQAVFIREGAVMKDLLRYSLTQISDEKDQKTLLAYIHNLLTVFAKISQSEMVTHDATQATVPAITSDNEELLSQREFEVFQLLIDGKAYKEIAMMLKISLNTVKAHVKHIYSKLDVNSRREIYAHARERNLIDV